MKRALVLLFLVLLAPSVAGAETTRVAVVVGNNAGWTDDGDGGQPPLRYAESDAAKVAQVLVELGGVAPQNLFLLQGRDAASLQATLARARRRVASYQKDPTHRVILIFYFSGHSDGMSLELGRDRFLFSELREWLNSTNAKVRLALVDSCKSGGLLTTKGGTLGPAFQIRLRDELTTSGEAILTSSAANELALESRELRGSFFTHHLLSGLRGAADTSGDAKVTLTEVYQYTYHHTIKTTGATIVGPQHPAYDYRISGQGELVLTQLAKSSMLQLPLGFERALITEVLGTQIIAELRSDRRRRIAVRPGRYAIELWRNGQRTAGQVVVKRGAVRDVEWDELTVRPLVPSRPKGAGLRLRAESFDAKAPNRRQEIVVAFGAQRAVAKRLGVLASVRVGRRVWSARNYILSATLGTTRNQSVRETSALVSAGYRLGMAGNNLALWGSLELEGGLISQQVISEPSLMTGALALVPGLGASFQINDRITLMMELRASVALVRRDDALTLVSLPGGWLGIGARY